MEGSVAVMVEGAPTDTVHFACRPAGAEDEPFTYAGAATNREAMASFAWDTLELPDDDYKLAALYTEDDGQRVIHDTIEVTFDNVDDGSNGGGCASVPVLPGGGRAHGNRRFLCWWGWWRRDWLPEDYRSGGPGSCVKVKWLVQMFVERYKRLTRLFRQVRSGSALV